ncbi:FecR family protein [Novosphingobium percolationis]|uniref:FecR family protein n=1 Tax=Novosphingobium percolationis TaxID=2871811 RepID=UPI001CD4F4C5|nr:FecR domain-containing protein [Novosphingobium percolationis]
MARKQIPENIRKEAADWLVRNEAEWAGEHPAEFEAWLARDLRHRLAYAEADRAWCDSLMLADTTIGRERTLARAPLHLRRSTHIAAMSLAVLIGVGLMTVRFVGTVPAIGFGSVVEAQTYRSAPGETRTWSLPDGSSLTLNGAALARAQFDGRTSRIDVEQGTARIRVVPNNARALEIHTAGLSATTREAVVEVVALPGANRILLVSGHASAAVAGGMSRALGAGQSIALPGTPEPKPTPTTASVASHPALLGLDGVTVAQAVERLNQTNRIQIRLASADIGGRRLIGGLRTDDPGSFAQTLAALDNLEVVRERDMIVLRPR